MNTQTTLQTVKELAQQLQDLGVNKSSAIVALKKKGYKIEVIDEAITEIYGETSGRIKADWVARVKRMRELNSYNKFTQKQIAEILVNEGLFGGLASANQCVIYIGMAQEWARQENDA